MKKFNNIRGIILAAALLVTSFALVFAATSGPALEVDFGAATGPAIGIGPDIPGGYLPAKPSPDISEQDSGEQESDESALPDEAVPSTTGPAIEIAPPATGPALGMEPPAEELFAPLAADTVYASELGGVVTGVENRHVIVRAGETLTVNNGGVLTAGVLVRHGGRLPEEAHIPGGRLEIVGTGTVNNSNNPDVPAVEVQGGNIPGAAAVPDRYEWFAYSGGVRFGRIDMDSEGNITNNSIVRDYANPGEPIGFVWGTDVFAGLNAGGGIIGQTVRVMTMPGSPGTPGFEAVRATLYIRAEEPAGANPLTGTVHAVSGKLLNLGGIVDFHSGVILGRPGNAVIPLPNTAIDTERSVAAVENRRSGTFNMHGGLIRGSEAGTGTLALYMRTGTVNIFGGRIVGPRAVSNAPAVLVGCQDAIFNMRGGLIDGDRGGANALQQSNNHGTFGIHIANGVHSMGDDDPNRPTWPANNVDGATIIGYVTAERPAVRIDDGSFTMYSGSIQVGNVAGSLEPIGVLINGGRPETAFVLEGGEIRNRLDPPAAVHNFSGTGVVHQGGHMSMMGGVIHSNRRGVNVTGQDYTTFVMQRGAIRNNRNTTAQNVVNADNSGAGVNINGSVRTQFQIQGTFIRRDYPWPGDFTVPEDAARIYGNIANAGAGVNIANGEFIMQGGIIGDPEAEKWRPAGYINNNGRWVATDTTRVLPRVWTEHNRVTEFTITAPHGNRTTFGGDDGGGGVRVTGQDSTLTMGGGDIIGNFAGIDNPTNGWGGIGGGVLIRDGAGFTLTSGYITLNSANRRADGPGRATVRASGGGVAVTGIDGHETIFNMSGGLIADNFARISGGGVAIRSRASLGGLLNDTTHFGTDNTANNNVRFYMSGGRIERNTVDDGRRNAGWAATFGGAGYYHGGGGVWVHGPHAEFNLSDNAVINDNHAIGKDNMGGGVFPVYFADFNMTGGTISNNVAGASMRLPHTHLAIGADLPWTYPDQPGGFFRGTPNQVPTGGVFAGGGGIGTRNHAWLRISGGTIIGNSSQTGGGLYVDNGSRLWIGHQAAITNPETALNTPAITSTGSNHWHEDVIQWDESAGRYITVPRDVTLSNVAVRVTGNHAYGRQVIGGRGNDGRGGGGLAMGDWGWPIGNAIISQRLLAEAITAPAPRGQGWRPFDYSVAHIHNGTAIYGNTSGGDGGGIYWWSPSNAHEGHNENFISKFRIDPGAYVAGNFSAQGTAMNDVWNDRHNLRIRSQFMHLPARPAGPVLPSRNRIVNPAPWHEFDTALHTLVTAATHPNLPDRYHGLNFTVPQNIIPMPVPGLNNVNFHDAPTAIAPGPRGGPGNHAFNNHDIRTFGESAIVRPPPITPPTREQPAEIELHVLGDSLGSLIVELEFDGEATARPITGDSPVPEVRPIVIREGTARFAYRQVGGTGVTASLNIRTQPGQPDWFRVTAVEVKAICRCMGDGSDVMLSEPILQDGDYVRLPAGTMPNPDDIAAGLVDSEGRVLTGAGQPILTSPYTVRLTPAESGDVNADLNRLAVFTHEFGRPRNIPNVNDGFPMPNWPYPNRPGVGGTYRIIVEVTVEPRPKIDILFNTESLHFGQHEIDELRERPLNDLIRLGEGDGSTNPYTVGFTVFNGMQLNNWHVDVRANGMTEGGILNNILASRLRVPGSSGIPNNIHGTSARVFRFADNWWATQPDAFEFDEDGNVINQYVRPPDPDQPHYVTEVSWNTLGAINTDIRVAPITEGIRRGEHQAELVWTLVGETP